MTKAERKNISKDKLSIFISEIKDSFLKERGKIRSSFEGNAARLTAGLDCAHALSSALDKTVNALFKKASEGCNASEIPALIATGGYGRGELAPFSDVDILFLISDAPPATSQKIVEDVLHGLWDLGLKVGHASRTVGQCLDLAEKDITIATNLLEHRFVTGNKNLFSIFEEKFKSRFLFPHHPGFIAAKMAERDRRHEKMGDNRYRLEPNVKESKGALRDLQTLYWLSGYLYDTRRAHDLVRKGVITKGEAILFERAHNFLWSVRCHLHYETGRAEDRLIFDLQPSIAKRLHYQTRGGQKGVERFMKHYFLIARDVGYLTLLICTALEEQGASGGATKGSRLLLGDYDLAPFILKGSRLTIPGPGHFKKNPKDMVGLFRVSQTTGIAIHAEALRALQQNKKALDKKARQDKDANRLFLDILTDPKNAAETLRRMNEAGLLGLFIPEFGRIVAHMQYDMYHTFTADEHTLQAISLMHDIENGIFIHEAPLATHLFPKIKSRNALYVAMLLHDIAKGQGGNHHALGEKVTQTLAPRLGLNPEETETAAWLVHHHLTMSLFSSKRDLNDPKTIDDFVAIVRSPERLRLLSILTTADIMAVGPSRWNSWKSSVLSDLYARTMERLIGDPKNRTDTQRISAVQDDIRRMTQGAKIDFERFVERMTPYYWLSLPPNTIARHALLLEKNAESTVDVFNNKSGDATEVTVITPDRKGLFALLTGALAAAGANISEARIFTLKDGTALDIFHVQDLNGKPFEDTSRLVKTLKGAMAGKLDIEKELAARKTGRSRLKHVEIAPRVLIDNDASVSNTVIEINAKDRPGLLYTLARTLTGLGLQISAAKIATYGSMAVDVFYVRDGFGLKIVTPAALEQIRRTVQEQLL